MIIDNDQTMIITAPCGFDVPVRVEINPRARRLILRLDEKHRQAVVVAPSRKLIPDAVRFAGERIDWAATRLRALPSRVTLDEGGLIRLRGRACRITLDGEGRRAALLEGDPQILSLPGDEGTIGRRALRFLKSAARDDLTAAVETYCAALDVDVRRVSVKDTRSRWGSCTSDGRLAFSWRLIMAPPEVLDYVAAHECAHLLEMNHSPRFWAHVARCRPNWKRERAWLRRYGSDLHAVAV